MLLSLWACDLLCSGGACRDILKAASHWAGSDKQLPALEEVKHTQELRSYNAMA